MGCRDIGIIKSEFVKKTQFFCFTTDVQQKQYRILIELFQNFIYVQKFTYFQLENGLINYWIEISKNVYKMKKMTIELKLARMFTGWEKWLLNSN